MPERGASSEASGPQTRASRARQGAAAVAIAICIGIAIYVYSRVGFDLDPRSVRDRIAEFGILAPAIYVGVATLRIFLGLPSGVVMSAGGLLFGVWGGLAFGFVGFMANSLLSFALARGLGRDAVAARLRGRARFVDEVVTRRGAPWMALYTAVPVSVLTPVHMAAGLSGMAVATFALAAGVGLAPRVMLYSVFGDAVASGEWGRIALAVAAIGVAGGLGTLAVRRWTGTDANAAANASKEGS